MGTSRTFTTTTSPGPTKSDDEQLAHNYIYVDVSLLLIHIPDVAFEALPHEHVLFSRGQATTLACSDKAIPTRQNWPIPLWAKSYTFQRRPPPPPKLQKLRTGSLKTAMIELNSKRGIPPIAGRRKAFRKSSVIFVMSEKSASKWQNINWDFESEKDASWKWGFEGTWLLGLAK